MQIRQMKKEELPIALEWANKEKWNPGVHDADTFDKIAPQGFFVGELNGAIIAVAALVLYGGGFGFFGLYIVKKEYRGKGYGSQLIKHLLLLAKGQGVNVGLNAVTTLIPMYRHFGYRLAHYNYLFRKKSSLDSRGVSLCVQNYQQSMFREVKEIDDLFFPVKRERFLQCWLSQPEVKVLVYRQGSHLLGYAVRRKAMDGFKIGPLFAANVNVAESLLGAMQNDIVGENIYIDVPAINLDAMKLVKKLGLSNCFATARMYLKEMPKVDYSKIYGHTAAELG